MKITGTKINFTGYSNVISQDIQDKNGRVMLLAAKLDDNGQQDLAEFKEFKRLAGLSKDAINNDILTILNVEIKEQGTAFHTTYLDRVNLIPSDVLKNIRESNITNNSLDSYIKNERIQLKGYTLASNLTKRMMNDNNHQYGEGLQKVIGETYKFLIDFLKDERKALKFLDTIMIGDTPPFQKVAKSFNDNFIKSMLPYFK